MSALSLIALLCGLEHTSGGIGARACVTRVVRCYDEMLPSRLKITPAVRSAPLWHGPPDAGPVFLPSIARWTDMSYTIEDQERTAYQCWREEGASRL